MNSTFTKRILLVAALLTTGLMTGQNNPESVKKNNPENIKMRIGGFGMKYGLLGLDDLGINGPDAPGGKIFFASVNGGNHFRFEPEMGYSNSVYTPPTGSAMKNKSVYFGGSMYGMFQRGNANFYIGFNLGNTKYVYDVMDYSTGFQQVKSKEGKATKFGTILGAEYFFNRHFSLGGEVGFFSRTYKNDITETDNTKTGYTNGNLVIRAYF